MSKAKYQRTIAEEKLGINFSKAFSAKDRVILMDKMLMLPMAKIEEAQKNAELPIFLLSCAKLLKEGNLCEYFEVFSKLIEICDKEEINTNRIGFI